MQAKVAAQICKIVSDISHQQKRDFTYENRVITVYLENPLMSPAECARRIGEKYNHRESGNSVIDILRFCGLSRVQERNEVFQNAIYSAKTILGFLETGVVSTDKIDELEKLMDRHPQTRRIAINSLFGAPAFSNNQAVISDVMRFSKDFARESIDSILSYIKVEFCDVGGTESYEKEIFRLEEETKRLNRLLLILQDGVDEEIEKNRKEDREQFIRLLNSSKYGYILDMLTELQVGIRKLRKLGQNIPLAINMLPSLIRQLLAFVEDCGIVPMLEIGEEFSITPADAENYYYKGKPFTENTEIKDVVVVKSGWKIRDGESILSLPTVQEKEIITKEK